MLRTSHNEFFSTGRAKYQYRSQTPGLDTDRIFIDIIVEGVQTTAALDTGGIYLILNPGFAEAIGMLGDGRHLSSRENLDPTPILKIRGEKFKGELQRISLEFVAEEGQGVTVEATAFIPSTDEQEKWNQLDLPNFLGFHGCMDRLRFAVDPLNDDFYFGADYG